jgi:O-antigen/teichoic acid export membrane protein
MQTPQIIDETLKKVAKGTTIVLVGTVIGMLLGFASRVIVVRYITQSEYGLFSLAVTLVGILSVIATLGLGEGATRYIAYFRGKNELAKIKGVIFSSLGFTLIASILLSIVLFFTSDILSTRAFNEPELSTPLKIFSSALPFSVLIGMLTTIFRGFGRVDVQVYFQTILNGALFPLLLGVVILLGLAFLGVIYASLAATVTTCLAFALYTIKKPPLPLKGGESASPVGKELLLFSLPLLVNSMLFMIIQWTDTIMLGYFKTSSEVGLYNGALPLARLVPIFYTSMAFIYVPVASQLCSRGLMKEVKRSYQVLTKWIFSLTWPLFLILLLFPITTLNFLFGYQYTEAAPALRILCSGLAFNTFLGGNGLTLIAMGKPRLLMWASLIGASLNVVLNAILIPSLGITGAAAASLASYFAINIFCSAKLYQLAKIHPFTKSYLKPVIASGIIIFIIYALATSLLTITFWMLPLFFILFLAIYALSLLLTKSFDNEDIMLLLAVEKRTGVDATPIKNILRRFI